MITSVQSVFILYEDDAIVAVNKPAWELSVPGKDPNWIPTTQKLTDYLGAAPFVVHRLDCATSGVMLFAKTVEHQRTLHRYFRKREISKIYQALLCEAPKHQQGVVNLPLSTDWPARPKQKVDPDGKDSCTVWSVTGKSCPLDSKILCTQVELRPKTGRTHQLRVHMAASGHAIVGDRLYAPKEFHSQPLEPAPFTRLYLHAYKLYFAHPATGDSMLIQAPSLFE